MNQPQDSQFPAQYVQQSELFENREETSAVSPPIDSNETKLSGQQTAQNVIAEFKKLAEPLRAVTEVRPGTPDWPEKLEAALARLPSREVSSRIEGLRIKATEAITQARQERVKAFRQIETEFLKTTKARGEEIQEKANGWRVGPLELQVRREQAQYRWLYNREVLIDWSRASSPDDLEPTKAASLKLLKDIALPDTMLRDAFWDAYQECVRLRQGKANPNVVPLLDFYQQLRLTLVKLDLAQKPEKKLSYVEFPRWAFLHNLDLYLKLSSNAPRENRLVVQTGSQQETQKLGMVTNGLDARQDYKVVCYILQS